jgi:rSAM/selenodomain-associated transferase 1
MTEHSNALLTVAKRPAAGQTKTRMTPPLAPGTAAALYECFLKDTLSLMRLVPATQQVIAYLPQGEENYFQGLAPGFELLLQNGSDLGSRLNHATTHFLAQGYRKVVIMDSDSPTLPVEHLVEAFDVLDDFDLSLGPCEDGGYYLIGLKQPAPRLLVDVQMSTPYVVDETLALAAEEDLSVHMLPEWYDVDDAAELVRLKHELAGLPANIAVHTRAILAAQGNLAG